MGYNEGFEEFMAARPEGAPFCFWLGAYDPHRPFKKGSGEANGLDPAEIDLFPFFPDCEEVRGDVADYYHEVGRFDSDVAKALAFLEANGELENTIIVMTGDHGMPFPRCKGNVHDSGARVPLAMRWGDRVEGGQVFEGFVSLTDLAPTFLAAAGVDVPAAMTGKSLLPWATGAELAPREFILCGRERHTPAQEEPLSGGYPVRSIRTKDFLYIHNFEPDRWPAGTPNWELAYKKEAWFGDCDNSPTKLTIVARRERDEMYARCYDLCFSKRPKEELYDLKRDPHQVNNIASVEDYSGVKERLSARLKSELEASGDPRVIGGAEAFDTYPYYGGIPTYPGDEQLKAYQ